MLPVLMAEDSMRTAEAVAVGSGALKKDARREVVTTWQKTASRGHRVEKAKLSPAAMQQFGIGFTVVTKKTAHGD